MKQRYLECIHSKVMAVNVNIGNNLILSDTIQ